MRIVGFHHAPEWRKRDIKTQGLKKRKKLTPKLLTGKSEKGLTVRKIFDEERPKFIQEKQLSSLFFLLFPFPHPDVRRIEYFAAKISKTARVADMWLLIKAIELCKGDKPTNKETKEIRELARLYWAKSVTLEDLSRYYTGTILRDTNFNSKEVVRIKFEKKDNAPPIMPKEINAPEILYQHNIKPQDLKKIEVTCDSTKHIGKLNIKIRKLSL